ncbi:cytochrome P450 [Flavisphingomonas formosensis]|uniref:cytochrome P450 n=1 Tax=Flavisphingomonas formosensis TaxID=861534 RepID=UPI0012FC8CFF|nr:cytochrome P450 [Sphingomonas formosensis]
MEHSLIRAEAALAPKPAHVPDDLVRDFDMARCADTGDVHRYWKEEVQDRLPDIFWTPHHGGHWVATRAADILAIQRDPGLFSNGEFVIPRGIVPKLIPLQLDPPRHTAYRRLFMPFFVPRALTDIEARARAVAIELIEGLRPRGECEFIGDFAGVMPIVAFLTMMHLPHDDLAMLRERATLASKPHFEGSAQAWEDLSAYIRDCIAARRAQPGTDPVSAMLQAEVDGERLSDDDVFSMCLLLLTGGLDTVATMIGFIAHYLATHPELQAQLREDPARIPDAVQEFVRRLGISNLGRLVTRDAAYRGIAFARDDMILLPMPLVGLDDRLNADPMDFMLDRSERHYSTFGVGPHACPGKVLAQREMTIFLQEWLTRLPPFRLKAGAPPVFTSSLINSVEALHLSW